MSTLNSEFEKGARKINDHLKLLRINIIVLDCNQYSFTIFVVVHPKLFEKNVDAANASNGSVSRPLYSIRWRSSDNALSFFVK